MTEEQAKTKVCCGPPFTEFEWGDLRQRKCIASACMAWRWTVTPQTAAKYSTLDNPQTLPTVESGHCGLAGITFDD